MTAIPRLLVIAALVGPLLGQDEKPFKAFDLQAFEQHARGLGATEEQLESLRGEVEQGFAGVGVDVTLRALVNEYAAAATLAEQGNPRAALQLARVLGTSDPYVRGYGRYHLGRVFLDGDDPEGAAEVFAEFMRDDRNVTPLDSEVLYFYGHSLAEIPDAARAVPTLRDFLEFFPGAPERYRASATQQIAELEGQEESALHEIADTMQGVERRIRKTDTGEETQTRQKDVMDKLAKIIEEMEEQEQAAGGSPGGISRPSNPATNSEAPEGATRVGQLGRVSGVVDRWGAMQDRDREAIETDLQTKLPGHYRRMLEEYYKRLGTGGQ